MKNHASTIAIALAFSFLAISSISAQEIDEKPQNRSRARGQRMQRPGGENQQGRRRGMEGKGNRQGRSGGNIAKMMFTRLDKNKDGVIDASEMPEKAKERFANIDANNDGKIDMKEIETAMANREGQGRGKPGQSKDGKGMRDKMKGRNGESGRGDMAKMMLQKMDKDGDGAISLDEAPDRLKQRFDQLDQNADGIIDSKELAAIAERMKNGMGGKKGEGKRGEGKGKGKGRGGKDDLGPSGGTEPQRPKRPSTSENEIDI